MRCIGGATVETGNLEQPQKRLRVGLGNAKGRTQLTKRPSRHDSLNDACAAQGVHALNSYPSTCLAPRDLILALIVWSALRSRVVAQNSGLSIPTAPRSARLSPKQWVTSEIADAASFARPECLTVMWVRPVVSAMHQPN